MALSKNMLRNEAVKNRKKKKAIQRSKLPPYTQI